MACAALAMLAAARGPEEEEDEDEEDEEEADEEEEEPSVWRRLPASAVASARCESNAEAGAVLGRAEAAKYAPLPLPPLEPF